jgi:hypothetical protein
MREHGRHVLAEVAHLERDAAAVAEPLVVLEAGDDIRVARERPEADLRVVIDGRVLTERAVDGIGILVELVGERVEVNGVGHGSL